jgi:hypothetical protein
MVMDIEDNMEAFWGELDQSIVIDNIDFFYLTKDKSHFSNGFIWEALYRPKME